MSQLTKKALYPIRNIKHHTYVKDIARYSIDRIAAEEAAAWGALFRARDLRGLHRRETMFNYNNPDNFCHVSRGWPRSWKDHKCKRQYLKHIRRSDARPQRARERIAVVSEQAIALEQEV